MANRKKPTRRQKELMRRRRLNCDNWYVVKNPPGELHLEHKHTGTRSVLKYAT